MLMGNGMGIVMILFWIIVLAAPVLVVFGAASGIGNRGDQTTDVSDPLEILKRRLPGAESTRPNTSPSAAICKPDTQKEEFLHARL